MELNMINLKFSSLIIVMQLALLTSAWADDLDQARKDRAIRKQIEQAIRAEKRDPKYSKLSLDSQMAKVLARVKQTMPKEAAAPSKVTEQSSTPQSAANERESESAASTTADTGVFSAKGPLALPPDSPWSIVVRKDFANIGIISTPAPGAATTGATISFTNDRIAKDVSWMAQGVGTVAYTIQDNPNEFINYAQVGVYGGVNSFSNTAAKPVTASLDNVLDGGFLEFGTGIQSPFANYFRVKAGSVENNIAPHIISIDNSTFTTTQTATQFSTSGEWMPFWNLSSYLPPQIAGFNQDLLPFNFEGSPYRSLMVQFNPEIIIQYDNTFNSTNILAFSNKSSALRLGPQAGLLLIPFPTIDMFSLNQFSIATFYHWYHEFEGNHNLYSFQTNLNYKISSESGGIGNIGLTVGYTRGSDENTGKNINLFKIGLTGQLCDGVNCKKQTIAAEGAL
jgi:hypothetical protein